MTENEQAKGIELVTAATLGMIEEVRVLLETPGYNIHYEDDLALRSASYTGYTNVVKLLVEKGANVQAGGGEALLYAAKRRDDSTVAYLLEKGADIDIMLRIHKKEVDQACLETLDKFQSQKLRDAFENNFARIKKPEDSEKFKLRKKPPSP